MAPAGYNYREVRIVYEDDLTHVYVLLEALGDCPIGVQGWHYKVFLPTVSGLDAMKAGVDAVNWPQEPPKPWGKHHAEIDRFLCLEEGEEA